MKSFIILLLGVGVLLPLPAQKVLADHDFSRFDGTKWQPVKCYQPFSAFEYTQNRGLVLKRNEKQKPVKGRLFDTAFDIRSKPLLLPPNAEVWSAAVTVFSSHRDIGLQGYLDDCNCRIVWYGKDGKILKGAESRYLPLLRTGKMNATERRGDVPPGAIRAEIRFGFDSPDLKQGEIIALRRLTLTVGSRKEMSALAPLGNTDHFVTLRSISPTEDAGAPLFFQIRNSSSIRWSDAVFLLNGRNVTENVRRKGENFMLKPVPAFDKGVNVLVIRGTDKADGPVELELAFYVGKVTPCHKMTLRDDGMAMMDGKPFFPLGIACLVKQGRNGNSYDRAFREISEAGMNFARHWSSFNAEWPDAKEYLACAKKYGVFVSFAPTKVKNDVKVSRIAGGVASQLNLEQVILWDTGDDTSSLFHPNELAAKYQAVKAVDPWRLTAQADSVGASAVKGGKSKYADYVKASDNYQPEIYPVGLFKKQKETPALTAAGVPQVIRDMKTVEEDLRRSGVRKNIWPLIQYFYCDPKSGYWARMPTEAEIRCMTLLAIIHGCHGIVWYRYAGYPKTPNAKRGYSDREWQVLATLSKQLRSIIGVLEARKGKQTQNVTVLSGPEKDAGNFDSMNTLLKEYNGKRYLFLANSAFADVTASVAVPGMKQAKDLFGGKTFPIENGRFTEAFSPFDARVFEIQQEKQNVLFAE